ncbi:tripartite tricarboxylate transporter TctB family protein [Paracoccus sp. Z330]|uniref:Tripartite tricarboxylate transporter TctB family protein n=1 Tax=Paracoccus onchidii TaxID=3017813 RepID=A0ABT4ZGG3_9RHOB|nr:tripartite tricarboxylate transporter TctB family protein [Paracoccus onchidii]MDB6178428.1 tripartite tricarboxylate transporter TctB family protein [Paracoccus onchidii]
MSTREESLRKTDRTLFLESIAVMAFAATMYGVTHTFREVPPILAQGIQPTAFPRAILIIMFLLAATQAFQALKRPATEASSFGKKKPVPPLVFLTIVLLIAFAMLMPIVGTFPAMAVFLPGLAVLWGERRWILMGLSFAGFIGFAYGLFVLIMQVPLP